MFQTREQWLEAAMSELSVRFLDAGKPLPDKIRVSCAFTSGGTRKKAGKTQIGECWDSNRSGDASFEIMISPVEDEPLKVLAILVHELCHAACGIKQGHRRIFGALARALHLEGPLTSTVGGADFAAMVQPVIDGLGQYPHSRLDTSTRAVQSTRMLKCVCPEVGCGYTVRISQKWLTVGAPHCPVVSQGGFHGAMVVE